MDTGNTGAVGECDVLVSSHVVADLGLWDKIDWHAPKKYKITANGTAMESEGTIKLTWKRAAGRNTRQDVFYVFRDLNEDINLGRNFLAALGIFQGFNVGILSTLKEAWTESECRSRLHIQISVSMFQTLIQSIRSPSPGTATAVYPEAGSGS
jgi:hypothetical protein